MCHGLNSSEQTLYYEFIICVRYFPQKRFNHVGRRKLSSKKSDRILREKTTRSSAGKRGDALIKNRTALHWRIPFPEVKNRCYNPILLNQIFL
jgi:hypothetical protein